MTKEQRVELCKCQFLNNAECVIGTKRCDLEKPCECALKEALNQANKEVERLREQHRKLRVEHYHPWVVEDEEELSDEPAFVPIEKKILAELQAKLERYEKVVEAAKALVEKLKLIWKSDAYQTAMSLAWSHGMEYGGPNCAEEQEALEQALKEGEPKPKSKSQEKRLKVQRKPVSPKNGDIGGSDE